MQRKFARNFGEIRLGVLAAFVLPLATELSLAQNFVWPVNSPTVSQTHACRSCLTSGTSDRYNSGINMHTGADVVGLGAVYTVPVKAAADGWVEKKITFTSSRGLGNTVILRHANGKYTLYGHLDSINSSLVVGQFVSQGTQLGIMGNSSDVAQDSFGIHVHFEIKDNPTLGNTSDSPGVGYVGYTPGHPDLYAYNDPRFLIEGISVQTITPIVLRNPPPSQLNIRGSPGTTYLGGTSTPIIGHLGDGQMVVAKKRADIGGVFWYFVDLPSRNSPLEGSPYANNGVHGGWISGGVAVEDSSATQVRVVSPEYNVRNGAGTGNSIIAKVYADQRFVVVGSPASGTGCSGLWYPIFVPGNSSVSTATGWICSDGIEIVGGDTTQPTVTINQVAGQPDPTSSSPINFTVVFSEAVTGFGSSGVTLGGSAGASSKTVTGSGTTYNVAVSGMTQSGTVTASVVAGAAQDAAGNASLASTSTDSSVTYNLTDTTPPTVTIDQATGQSDPTSSSPINFTVVFSEAVTGFGNSDVTLGGTAGASSKTVTGSGTTYNVAVSGVTQSGTVTATVVAGAAQDAAGNASLASASTDNNVTYNLQVTGYPGATYYPAGAGNFGLGRNGNNINYIILHTLEGTASAALSYFQTPGVGASSHYIVSVDGTIAQLVNDLDTAYHAGNLSYNYQSIGIELEGWADGNPDFSWQSDAQFTALTSLINWLSTQHSIPKDRAHIFGHNQVPSPGGGGNPPTTQWGGASNHYDPGAWYNWRRLMTALGRTPCYTAIQVQSATSILTLPQVGAQLITPAAVGQRFVAYDSQAGYYLVFLSGTNLSQQNLSGRESHWDGWIPAANVSVLSSSAQLEVAGVFPGRLNIRNAAGTSGTTVTARTIDGKRYVPTGNTANADGFTWREFYIATTNNAVVTGWAIADNLTVIGGDTTPPSVTINQAAGQSDPTSSSPINFTVVFNEAVTGFASSDVTLGGTAGATTKTVTGSSTTYNVAVSGMTQSGTVTAIVTAGVAQDAAGNASLASTSSDNSVAYTAPDTTPPTVTINQAAGQSDPTGNSSINFIVVFSEAVTGFGSSDVPLGGTAGATSKSVTGSGTDYTLAVSGMTQSGTVTATVPAGAAQDGAGNSSLASTSSDNSVIYSAPPQTGSLLMNLAPAGAVSAGAQWQVDGGAWQNSGAAVSGLSVGTHTVAFKMVSGWTPPGNQNVTINANQTTTAAGTYEAISQLPKQLTEMTLSNDMFRFKLNGLPGSNYVIQVSSNLVNWLPISTNTIPSSGTVLIAIPTASGQSGRFYRAVLFVPPVSVGLITNGSFEIPGLPANSNLQLFAGDTNLFGWTIGGAAIGGPGPVLWANCCTPAPDGAHYLDFNSGNTPNGSWIAQDFNTASGQTYDVTFYVGRTGNGAGTVSLRASATSDTGTLLNEVTVVPSGEGFGAISHLVFTATSTTTRLEFRDTSASTTAVDILLDNVAVQ